MTSFEVSLVLQTKLSQTKNVPKITDVKIMLMKILMPRMKKMMMKKKKVGLTILFRTLPEFWGEYS